MLLTGSGQEAGLGSAFVGRSARGAVSRGRRVQAPWPLPPALFQTACFKNGYNKIHQVTKVNSHFEIRSIVESQICNFTAFLFTLKL